MNDTLKEIQSQLNPTSFSFNGEGSGEQLLLSVYGGRVGFTIFPPKGAPRGATPPFSMNFTGDGHILFKNALKALATMHPGQNTAINHMCWDENADPKFFPDSTLKIGKDESQVCYFEFSYKADTPAGKQPKVLRFNFKATSTFQMSKDSASPKGQSDTRLSSLIDWIDYEVPVIRCLTSHKPPKKSYYFYGTV